LNSSRSISRCPPSTSAETAKPDDLSERRATYQTFFQALIDELRDKHHFTNQRVAQPQNWVHFSAGVAGIRYGVTFSVNGLRTELYIDASDGSLNRAIFEALETDREQIEQTLGFELSWEPLDTKRACRISTYREAGSLTESNREQLLAWTVEMLLKFRSALGPRLRQAVARAGQIAINGDQVASEAAA
jgi:hypothetical protein